MEEIRKMDEPEMKIALFAGEDIITATAPGCDPFCDEFTDADAPKQDIPDEGCTPIDCLMNDCSDDTCPCNGLLEE